MIGQPSAPNVTADVYLPPYQDTIELRDSLSAHSARKHIHVLATAGNAISKFSDAAQGKAFNEVGLCQVRAMHQQR